MTGATPRALRHYEAAGLIRPHRTTTGVRLFTADQCERASLIVRLRRCDLSLDEIRDVLTDASADHGRLRMRQMLQRKAAELNRTLTLVRDTLAQVA